MQTAPTPEQGSSLTFAPVSPAIAKLLHQLQAQIIREAGERNYAQLTLTPDDEVRYTRTEHRERGGHRVIECFDAAGNQLHLQTPTAADPSREWCRPGRWYGNEARVDSIGRLWRHTLRDEYVMDDFGTLVPVPESLQ